jgi:transcriptional regulator with XRE-family HTH domain
MPIIPYLDKLGWSMSDLAQKAEIDLQTVSRMNRGESVRRHTVARVAKVLSEALKEDITVERLWREGVRVKGLPSPPDDKSDAERSS